MVVNKNLTGVHRAFIDKLEIRVAGVSARQVIGFDRRHISAIVRSVWGFGVAVWCKRQVFPN